MRQRKEFDISRRELLITGAALAATTLIPQASHGAAAQNVKPKRILLINAHQVVKGISEGRLNRTMAELIKADMQEKNFEVRETYIEKGYQNTEEVEKHLWADIIITQSPVYWFGSPWIYKKYVDDVFTTGLLDGSMLSGDGRSDENPDLQYGSGGKMIGKKYMLSLTMNSPAEAFNDPSQNLHRGMSLDDLFHANTANYRFCGVEIVPAFACFNVVKAADVPGDTKRLKEHLSIHFG